MTCSCRVGVWHESQFFKECLWCRAISHKEKLPPVSERMAAIIRPENMLAFRRLVKHLHVPV